jgi:hypothetical protein
MTPRRSAKNADGLIAVTVVVVVIALALTAYTGWLFPL